MAERSKGRPFTKGQSGNPGGRPKDALSQLIRERTKGGKVIMDLWMAIAEQDTRQDGPLKGLQPNVTQVNLALENLAEWGFTKPERPVEVSGVEAQPLVVQLVSYAEEPST